MNEKPFLKRPKAQQRIIRLMRFFRTLPRKMKAGFLRLFSGLKAFTRLLVQITRNIASAFLEGDWKTRTSFFIMGFGSFARKQRLRGFLFFLFQVSFTLYMIFIGLPALQKLPSLGTVETRKIGRQTVYGDNSFLILLYGVLTLFFVFAYLYTWYINIRQNQRAEFLLKKGKSLPSARQDIAALGDGQFHKTLLALPTLGVALFTILPIFFMILVAFTNYDAQHQPPQKLFSWVGFENFRTLLSNERGSLQVMLSPEKDGSSTLTVTEPGGDVLSLKTRDTQAAEAAFFLSRDPSTRFALTPLTDDSCRITFQNSAGTTATVEGILTRTVTGASFAYTFRQVLLWTLIWAFFATFLNYFLGMLVAILINKPGIRFKKLWRTLLVITIAVPQFISLLYISKLFTADGLVNGLLMRFGLIDQPLPFWTNPIWARITIILVNVWVGIPYIMLIATGILLNIPRDLYESARIDGANAFQTYRSITLPYMLFITGPYLLTSFTGNINNFNVIFLLSQGKPLSLALAGNSGNTDLLITWLYKMTVTDSNYKLAAVMGVLVFIICAVINLIVYNLIPSVKHEEDFQ